MVVLVLSLLPMAQLSDITNTWRPIFGLERLLSRRRLQVLRLLFGWLSLLFLSLTALDYQFNVIGFTLGWLGLALISFGLWLEQVMLYSYHNHRYFAGLNSLIGRNEISPSPITYDVAAIVNIDQYDLTRAFLTYPLGITLCKRLGLPDEVVTTFLNSQRHPIPASSIRLDTGTTFSVADLGTTLLERDPDLRRFIEEYGITITHWRGALRWVVLEHIQQKLQARWWSKDNLLRTTGLGNSWSYGYTNQLNRYQKPTHTSAVFSVFGTMPAYAYAKVEELEETLIREKAGNALIIGEAGVGKTDIVVALEQRIKNSETIAGLQNRRIVTLDTERFLATIDQPAEVERAFITALNEALDAGNCIVVIENLSTFINTALERGVHIPEILDTYLAHPDIKFIAADTPGAFHTYLQPLGALTRRFGQVIVDIPDTDSVVQILQRACRQPEKTHQIFFTYQALIAIAQGAKRYVTDGVLPDSALTLLVEVASEFHHNKDPIITPERIHQFMKAKTGIPMGAIDEEERDVLLHLEDTLHDRVIGQDAAIDAIAKTIRRARVGIQNSERPIGSFLFLGPTGVGKTETAKTLAAVFFKSEDNMIRYDMSEFSGTDALNKLIGTGTESGLLADALHDHPYTVLLLDEFEKASRTVHDLFLQILDEGSFTDGRGNRVNARNTIIIATSNAGSDLIYKTTEQRSANPALNQHVIDHIIVEGLFRPELINRFDNTIIFEPLKASEQERVAQLMLRDLVQRMQSQGYQLAIAPEVVSYLANKGYNAAFGARAMRREIQDSVEAIIANKIISAGLQPGDQINLTVTDLASLAEAPPATLVET